MRALKSDGQTLRLVRDHPEPTPAPGEAVIKPTRVLLTPADAAALRRDAPRPFVGVIGHQFVGVIKKLNIPADAPATLAARKSWLGRRVVASSSIPCGNCDLCRRALSPHCRDRRVPGIADRDGCLAELFTMPIGALHAVPDNVDDDAAVLSGYLASAAHTANLLRSEEHAFTTVLGDSALALLTARVLTRKNATVRLLSARPEIAELCDRWGIKQRSPDEPGRRQDQDVVVECTATAAGLHLALQMVRPRGLIVLKSSTALAPFRAGAPFPEPAGAPIDLTPAIVNEVQIVGSREGPIPDALALLSELARAGAGDLASVLTLEGAMPGVPARLRFEDALDAITAAGARAANTSPPARTPAMLIDLAA